MARLRCGVASDSAAGPAPGKLPAIADMNGSAEEITGTSSGSTANGGYRGNAATFSKPQLQLSALNSMVATTPVSALFQAGASSAISMKALTGPASASVAALVFPHENVVLSGGIHRYVAQYQVLAGELSMPNQAHVLTLPDGHKYFGETDADGNTVHAAAERCEADSAGKGGLGSEEHQRLTPRDG
jgi:uncharacterized protein (DUF2345 family)